MPSAQWDDASDDGAPAGEPAPRLCQYPGCHESGTFKAPRSRRTGDGLYWFCLSHVRDFNAGWNFFAGMSRAEIERYQQDNPTWHRPTWQFGTRGSFTGRPPRFVDPLDLFQEATAATDGARPPAAPRPTSAEERRALALLDLPPSVTLQELKSRYKQLVKRFHPDANGGSKAAEERLKRINQAYDYLLSCGYT